MLGETPAVFTTCTMLPSLDAASIRERTDSREETSTLLRGHFIACNLQLPGSFRQQLFVEVREKDVFSKTLTASNGNTDTTGTDDDDDLRFHAFTSRFCARF
jgi:hypothetical protein